jgi:hypothetical protein
MTKRSFRHWQKSSKRSISKITKQHIVVVIVIVTVIIIIAVAVPQIVQHLKKENSKPPLLYLLSSTGLEASWKSNLQKTTTKQNKGKRRKKQRTHT